MIVGEAYGRYEALENKPFVGPAGRVLQELLLKAGINPASVYYTNLVNAQPPGNDLSTWFPKGIPSDLAFDGLDSLAQEIEDIAPNVIVPVGNWPLWAFYGQKLNKDYEPTGILDYRGYILEARKLARGKKIIPTVHPSFILQGGSPYAPLAILDLKRARAESNSPEIRRRPRLAIVNPTGADREVIRSRLLSEGRRLVVDIEYIGTRLLCVGFAVSADWATTIVINSVDDLAWCKSLIESGRPLAAQNGMFDFGTLDWHYQLDAIKHLDFDTMVAAYNINIEYKKDLGFLAGMYTDLDAWWDNINWNDIKSGKQSISTVWEYNCIDCMATYEIMEKQEPELASDPKMLEAFRFDMKKLRPLWEFSKRGVLIDQAQIERTLQDAKLDEIEAQNTLNELNGGEVNVKSPLQVPEFLAKAGVRLTKKTPVSGRFKIDNGTLMDEMRKADKLGRFAIEQIIKCREARDIESKFGGIEWDDDGRARCIYDATKTTTRRLSSKTFFPTGKGSNLQNQPAPGSSNYGDAVRKCFIADPGMEFGYADLKGAEFLIVAHLTQDPLMLKYAQMTIDGSGDVHRETAAFIFSRMEGKTILPHEIPKDSPKRFLGKKTRHSANYLVGWKELMTRINAEALETGVFVTAAEIKLILEGYHALHPGLRHWWNDTESEVRQTGMLRNLFGFPRRFHGHISQILTQAVAFVPQSTVGDALNMGLVACHDDPELLDLGYQDLLNVHDAIGFQYPISQRDAVVSRVRELMSIPITIPKTGDQLRIPVEIAVGPNWGTLEVVK